MLPMSAFEMPAFLSASRTHPTEHISAKSLAVTIVAHTAIMRFSAISRALLAVGFAQAYEIVLYSKEGWSGDEVSYSIDGNHQIG